MVEEQRVKGRGGVHLSISRSAGMFWGQAADPVNKLFHQYWDNGTMFESPKDIKSARNMNPTFAYSIAGEKFIPHYASFPPQAFHLSSAFAPIVTGHSPGTSPKSIMSTVREQFESWCSAFKTATKEYSSLTLHYCVGNALSVSHALSHRQADPKSPASFALTDWSMKALDLDGDVGPTTFDVIDTSNLMDHLGLLNLLVATKPLLRAKTTSTLYTEGLLPFGDDPAASLLERLCGDVPTMSSLLGLAPRGLLSGFSTQSTVHEIVYNQESDKQFHERFAWCRPTCDASTPPEFGLTFAVRDLARFIFNVYDRMLDVERTDMMMRKPKTLTSIAHYNRASFAYVLHSIRSRTKVTQAEWDTAMDDFHDLVSSDQSRIIGANLLQDLWLQLHLHGLYTTPVLSPSWKIHAAQYKDPNNDIFKEWKTVPPVVCVILVIPRSAYASILEDSDIRTIPMHVHTLHNHRTGRSSNHFSCNLQVAPGRIDVMQGHPPSVLIEEDTQGGAAGLRESQSLIVSFLMPSWLLTMPGTTVALAFGASVSSSMKLMRRLGMHQELFSASVTDKKHVHILPRRPNVQKELESFVLPLHPTTKTSAITYMAQMDASCQAIRTITARVDLATKYANALSQDLDISSQHLSPCSVRLDVAGEPTTVIFLYPIKGEDRKLRIARKSRYIEVRRSSSLRTIVPDAAIDCCTTFTGSAWNYNGWIRPQPVFYHRLSPSHSVVNAQHPLGSSADTQYPSKQGQTRMDLSTMLSSVLRPRAEDPHRVQRLRVSGLGSPRQYQGYTEPHPFSSGRCHPIRNASSQACSSLPTPSTRAGSLHHSLRDQPPSGSCILYCGGRCCGCSSGLADHQRHRPGYPGPHERASFYIRAECCALNDRGPRMETTSSSIRRALSYVAARTDLRVPRVWRSNPAHERTRLCTRDQFGAYLCVRPWARLTGHYSGCAGGRMEATATVRHARCNLAAIRGVIRGSCCG
jgi:hypothetical protein